MEKDRKDKDLAGGASERDGSGKEDQEAGEETWEER